jgi:phosphoesterase RecJ-like protein
VKAPENLISFLKKENRFFIATHINPDGDAFGSAIALSLALESAGKQTIVFDRDTVPDLYQFLPENTRITHTVAVDDPSIWNLILLDCNTPDRAGIEGFSFRSSAVIDHHETANNYGDIQWIEPDAAATGLMLFYLLRELGIPLTKEIATNLYCAIAVDTGTFRYSNTTADVLKVGAELVQAGANPSIISNNLYETWSEGRFQLLVDVLNTLEIRDTTAFVFVTREMLRKTGAAPADAENFVGFPRMMKDIRLSVLFREIEENFWKVSLRAKGDINVARIAALFGGGGHENAAGYRTKTTLSSAMDKLLQAIPRKATV